MIRLGCCCLAADPTVAAAMHAPQPNTPSAAGEVPTRGRPLAPHCRHGDLPRCRLLRRALGASAPRARFATFAAAPRRVRCGTARPLLLAPAAPHGALFDPLVALTAVLSAAQLVRRGAAAAPAPPTASAVDSVSTSSAVPLTSRRPMLRDCTKTRYIPRTSRGNSDGAMFHSAERTCRPKARRAASPSTARAPGKSRE